jgi:division protein CdvB (Snf7/Vps24/ESCRT-III family)
MTICTLTSRIAEVQEVRKMSRHSETPFDNIESSHEYVGLLAEATALALSEVEADIANAAADSAERRKEALKLVAFKLSKLSSHMAASRRILNDLRSLRRLLLEERSLSIVVNASE